jgi:hypothetical protein
MSRTFKSITIGKRDPAPEGLCEIAAQGAAHNKKIKIKIENTPQISIPGDLSSFHVPKLVRQ